MLHLDKIIMKLVLVGSLNIIKTNTSFIEFPNDSNEQQVN